MSAEFNYWMALSKAFQTDMVRVVRDDLPALEFLGLNHIHDNTKKMFSSVGDLDALNAVFLKWGAKDYRMWSPYLGGKPENAAQVRADLDQLEATYTEDFNIVGMWHYSDGRPVGTQWDESGEVLTGTPWHDQPPYVINFMPDVIVDNTDPENPVYGRPTELSDVLLLAGQAPRDFTSLPP